MIGLYCILGTCESSPDDDTGGELDSTGPTPETTPENTPDTSAEASDGSSTSEAGTGTSMDSSTAEGSESSTSATEEEGTGGSTSGESTSGESTSGESTSGESDSDSSDSDSECDPDSSRCVGVTQVQTCNMQGMWEPPQACVNQACVNKQCAGLCFPGNTQCVDVARVQSCSDKGQWKTPSSCGNQTCIGKQCTGECAQGQKRCQGLQAQSCNTSGLWTTQRTCDGPNQACEMGECVTTCEPWIRQLGTKEIDQGRGVAVDRSGNVYIVGNTEGALDGNKSAGDRDIVVVKYSSEGAKVWTRQLGTSDYDSGYGIAVDGSANVYLTGTTFEALDGNNSAGESDIVVAKYSTSGEKIWTRQLGTADTDYGTGIAVDGLGNVYISGDAAGALDGNNAAGGTDIVVAKYSASGSKIWTRQLGTSDEDFSHGIAVDGPGNNVYLTGGTRGALDGNNAAGGTDIVVAKYSASGSKIWTRQLGSSDEDEGYGIAVDGSSSVYITGNTRGALDGNNSAGGRDIVVAKYSVGGSKVWTRQLGTSDEDYGRGIAKDGSGNVYVTGETIGALGGNNSAGGFDIMVAKYRSNGAKIWTKQLGSSQMDYCYGIAVDGSGHAFITGETNGALDGNNSLGSYDAFVARVCKD